MKWWLTWPWRWRRVRARRRAVFRAVHHVTIPAVRLQIVMAAFKDGAITKAEARELLL